jgi:hypothetical protein
MTQVFVNIGLSLDGYMAPEGMTLEHWATPAYKDWGAQWGALMGWIMNQEYFRANLKLGPGGADLIPQYLNLGVVDELDIALTPVLFGGGRRLFENLREPAPRFRVDRVVDTPAATHLRYVRV